MKNNRTFKRIPLPLPLHIYKKETARKFDEVFCRDGYKPNHCTYINHNYSMYNKSVDVNYQLWKWVWG